jgi:hypothetical protein
MLNSLGHVMSVHKSFFLRGKLKEKSQSVLVGRAATRFVNLRLWACLPKLL